MDTITTTDKIKLMYSSRGEGQPIVMVHGFGGEGSSFRVLDKILSRNFKTIELDMRGHGKSDTSENVTIDLLARDLRDLINALKLEKPVLAGWSMGGAVIFDYIRQFGLENIAGIILIETSPKVLSEEGWTGALFRGKYSKEYFEKDKRIIASDWMSFAESFVHEMGPNIDEKSLRLAVERISGNRPEVMSTTWESLIEKDYRDLLDQIDLPVLVVNGKESTFYDPESGLSLSKMLPQGSYALIERAGHLVVMENPVALNRVITDFIINKIQI